MIITPFALKFPPFGGARINECTTQGKVTRKKFKRKICRWGGGVVQMKGEMYEAHTWKTKRPVIHQKTRQFKQADTR